MDYLEQIDYDNLEFSEFYDELPLWSAPFGLLLLDRVPIKSGLTILDVGCGSGFLSVELAQRCGSDATVIAIDPWKSAISRLQSKLDFLNLRNVQVIEQDAAQLDLPDASVDVVLSNLGINNFDNPAKVLEACFRVARPAATVVLTTNLMGHMNEFYDVFRNTLDELGHIDRLSVLEAHISHRGTVDSVTSLLQSAGFEVSDVATDSFQMRFADGSALLRHFFIRLGFMPGWKAVVAEDRIEQTFHMLEAKLNILAKERGDLALTIPIACVQASKPVS